MVKNNNDSSGLTRRDFLAKTAAGSATTALTGKFDLTEPAQTVTPVASIAVQEAAPALSPVIAKLSVVNESIDGYRRRWAEDRHYPANQAGRDKAAKDTLALENAESAWKDAKDQPAAKNLFAWLEKRLIAFRIQDFKKLLKIYKKVNETAPGATIELGYEKWSIPKAIQDMETRLKKTSDSNNDFYVTQNWTDLLLDKLFGVKSLDPTSLAEEFHAFRQQNVKVLGQELEREFQLSPEQVQTIIQFVNYDGGRTLYKEFWPFINSTPSFGKSNGDFSNFLEGELKHLRAIPESINRTEKWREREEQERQADIAKERAETLRRRAEYEKRLLARTYQSDPDTHELQRIDREGGFAWEERERNNKNDDYSRNM